MVATISKPKTKPILREPMPEDYKMVMKQALEMQSERERLARLFIERDGFYYDPILKKCVTEL